MASVKEELQKGYATLGYMQDKNTAVVIRQNGSYIRISASNYNKWSLSAYAEQNQATSGTTPFADQPSEQETPEKDSHVRPDFRLTPAVALGVIGLAAALWFSSQCESDRKLPHEVPGLVPQPGHVTQIASKMR